MASAENSKIYQDMLKHKTLNSKRNFCQDSTGAKAFGSHSAGAFGRTVVFVVDTFDDVYMMENMT